MKLSLSFFIAWSQVCTKDSIPDGENEPIVGVYLDVVNIMGYSTTENCRYQSIW